MGRCFSIYNTYMVASVTLGNRVLLLALTQQISTFKFVFLIYRCTHFRSTFTHQYLPPCLILVAVLTPLHYTAYLGEPAVGFHCSAANASDTSWRINGRPIGNNIADLNARGISVETDNSLLESNLTISSVVSNNNTHILCVAHHLVEFRYVPTAEATFQVQGQSAKIIYILNNLCHALYHANFGVAWAN